MKVDIRKKFYLSLLFIALLFLIVGLILDPEPLSPFIIAKVLALSLVGVTLTNMLALFVSEETDERLNTIVKSLTYNLAGESSFTEIERRFKYHYYKTCDCAGNPYWVFIKYEWQEIPGRSILYTRAIISIQQDIKKTYDVFLLKFHRCLVLVINDAATSERTAVDIFPREVGLEAVYGVQIHDTWSPTKPTKLHPTMLTAIPLKTDNDLRIDSQERLSSSGNEEIVAFLEEEWSNRMKNIDGVSDLLTGRLDSEPAV